MPKYVNIRDQLQTGDIVLFSGKGGISAGIKWATTSRWSHVGMVLRLAEFDMTCLWESTTLVSDVKDIISHKVRQGVQLVPLSDRVQRYDGDIAVRRLQGVDLAGDAITSLGEFRREVTGRPYEQSKIELIKAAYDGPFGANHEDLSSLFCSELVAEAYLRLGLLDEGKPSNEYTPADFSDKRGLKLLRGSLGPELLIKDA